MSEYYTIITEKGLEILLECIEKGSAFPAAKMSVGDSNGSYYEPSASQTALKNVKYTSELYAQGKKNGYLYFDLQIPPSEGNYYIREVGLFDEDNNLLAAAKYPETYKQQSDDGSSKSLLIELQIMLSSEAINTIVIDDSGNLATLEELENYQKTEEKGAANGYASLDESGKVPAEQLPQTDTGADSNLSNLTGIGLSQYNAFCVNTGEVDEEGNPSFLAAEGGTYSTLTSTAVSADLEDFQAITDGSAVITINNETYTVSDVDLSAVTSYADIAQAVQTAIQSNADGGDLWTSAAVTYDETSESFVLTAGRAGAYAMGYASTAQETVTDEETEEETTSVIGTDISSLIGWSEADEPEITTGEALTLTSSGSFDVTTANGSIYTISDTLEYTAADLEDGTYNIFIDPVNKTISLSQNEITIGSAFPSSAVSGDYLLNTSQVPYDLQQITITTTNSGISLTADETSESSESTRPTSGTDSSGGSGGSSASTSDEDTDEETEEETDEETEEETEEDTEEDTEEETTTTTVTKGLNEVLAGTLTISSGEGNLTLNSYNSNNVSSSNSSSNSSSIGDPVITLSGTLGDNEIWLEGAEVSKTTYAALYGVYGDTYGTPEDEDNFVLPDFRGRAIWGNDSFGYIDEGLPTHTHTRGTMEIAGTFTATGDTSSSGSNTLISSIASADSGARAQKTSDSTRFFARTYTFKASQTWSGSTSEPSDSIYGNSDTVQPPAICVRVKTRYA